MDADSGERTDLAGIVQGILKIPVGAGRVLSIRRTGREAYELQNLGPLGDTMDDLFESWEHIVVPSDIEYGKIVLNEEARKFFPGVRQQFVLETDIGSFLMHRQHNSYANAPRPNEAKRSLLVALKPHGVRTFKTWYDRHKNVKPGNKIKVYKIDHVNYQLVGPK